MREKGDGETFLGVSGYNEEQKIPDDFIKSWTDTTNEDSNFKKAVYALAINMVLLPVRTKLKVKVIDYIQE